MPGRQPPKLSLKQERMSDRIREILSSVLLIDVTDPALSGVTVTEVMLDAELEYADIYVNALGDESRETEVMRGLTRANGFLRREVGARVHLRRAPVLHFHWDQTLKHTDAMEKAFQRIGPIPPPDPADVPTVAVEQAGQTTVNTDTDTVNTES